MEKFYIQHKKEKMKRLMAFLIMVCFAGVLSAQTSNTFKYVLKSQGGIINTKKGLAADKIDSMKVSSDKIWFFQGADTLIVGVTSEGSLNLFDYAARKYPDTLLVTTAEYRPTLTHAGRLIRVNRGTQVKVFLPPDSTVNFPLNTILTFKMDGAGIVSFYKGTGVTRQSKLDSMTMNTQHTWSQWIKRAANKWEGLGDL